MMSFQTLVVVFQIFGVFMLSNSVRAAYESNPFFKGGQNLTKDINQFNVAVIIPAGNNPQPEDKPPSPPAPGYIWVQVPLSVSINDHGFSTAKPLPPAVTQQPPAIAPTKEPLFTIEPPEVLYGGDLNKFCLKPKGQFPSNSCDKYVNCWEGVGTEQTCPQGFRFNPVKLYCDYAGNVDCQGRPVLKNPTPVPIAAPISYATFSTPTYHQTVSSSPSSPTAAPSYDSSSNPTHHQTVSSSPRSPTTAPSYASSSNPTYQSVSSSPKSPTAALNPSLRSFCLRSTGLFPGSTCGKFVNCWDGNAVEQDCPAGLYFSSEGYCDYARNVACDREGVEEVAARKNARDSECPLEFGSFRDINNCSQYVSCAYYKVAAKYVCPDGLSFSDILGVCDYSYRVDCTKIPQIYEKTVVNNIVAENNALSSNAFAHPDLSKPVAVGDSRCIVASGLVRDKDNCSSYYVCESGRVMANYVCPPGYKFSNELGVCDHEGKVNCDNPSRIYDPSANTLSVPDIPKELLSKVQNCHPGSVFRLNPECTIACRCRNGSAEIIQCSAGLAYDSLMDKCIPAHLARC